MTPDAKIDPVLRDQLREASGRVPVLIELASQPQAGLALDRHEGISALEETVEAAQAGLLAQLESFGIAPAEVISFMIVNAVATALDRDEVAAVSEREDVTYIRYNGEAHVAL